jgi:hypothetical protein
MNLRGRMGHPPKRNQRGVCRHSNGQWVLPGRISAYDCGTRLPQCPDSQLLGAWTLGGCPRCAGPDESPPPFSQAINVKARHYDAKDCVPLADDRPTEAAPRLQGGRLRRANADGGLARGIGYPPTWPVIPDTKQQRAAMLIPLSISECGSSVLRKRSGRR